MSLWSANHTCDLCLSHATRLQDLEPSILHTQRDHGLMFCPVAAELIGHKDRLAAGNPGLQAWFSRLLAVTEPACIIVSSSVKWGQY